MPDIRLHRLITIPTRIIKRQLGKLPSSHQQDLEQRIKQLWFSDKNGGEVKN